MYRAFLVLFFTLSFTYADVLPGWEGVESDSNVVIDHGPWQAFLDEFLQVDGFGQTYFAYSKVSRSKQQDLDNYISELQKVDPLSLSANEQKAFWFNLYNAVTVKVILEEYPIKSIRDIGASLGGLIPGGPWKLKIIKINGQELSLDDVEHNIVRPKFNDHRVHFALNCAAMGCPNLASTAYSGSNIESLLTEAEKNFINHQRGVRFQGGKLIVSKIFEWYQEDFVQSEAELPNYLAQYAEPKLRAQLKGYRGNIKFEYDWSLNEVIAN